MSNIKVFINPLDDNGAYTEYIDVTQDVNENSISKISRKIDSSEYDVGVSSYSNLTLKMRNNHGKYSEIGTPRTIFKKKRNESLCKILWYPNISEAICGAAVCGSAVLGDAVEIFKGLLNDDSLKSDIDTQEVSFVIRGMESIFETVETPYSSLSTAGVRTVIADILTVPEITSLLTVSIGNIDVAEEHLVDDITPFEDTTVKDALNKLLEASGAILYVKDDTVYVKPRAATTTDPVTFYGQASNIGIENLIDATSIRSGRNKMFNYWTWADTTLKSTNASSIDDYGIRLKEIDFDVFTNNTTRQNILDELSSEFSLPREEMEITVPMNYTSLNLFLLDRVNIDYPTIYMPANPTEGIRIYGKAIYGVDRYPLSQWSLSLTLTDIFKIIGISQDVVRETITFNLKKELA